MSSDQQARRALGNGAMLAFLSGASVREAFGPVYSSPTVFQTHWELDGFSEAVEQPGLHVLSGSEGQAVSCHLVATMPVLRYDFRDLPLMRLEIRPGEGSQGWTSDGSRGRWLAEIPAGARVYIYPTVQRHFVVLEGDLSRDSLGFRLQGTGTFVLSVATAPEVAMAWAAQAHQIPREESIAAAVRLASGRLAGLAVPESEAGGPLVRWEAGVDQILAQQSAEGGFAAGHNYALSYLRDSFGACEGLGELGIHPPVRRHIDFRLEKWRHCGGIANAEAMGADHRHIHENDDVEITAYLVLLILRYSRRSGDREVLDHTRDLIVWCLRRQSRWLHEGSLPFNGDETYIAGGLLPRWVIEDGSLEATALYAAALAGAVECQQLRLSRAERQQFLGDLHSVVKFFSHNFVRGEVIVTNSLRRRVLPLRERRVGVCEACSNFIVETTAGTHGRYLCKRCVDARIDARPSEERVIPSATLIGYLAASSVLPCRQTDRAATLAIAAGSGVVSDDAGTITTGYDRSLLLRAAVALRHPKASEVAAATASLADRYGTWAEFYRDGAPLNTRCRAWETGMNLAALAINHRTADSRRESRD